MDSLTVDDLLEEKITAVMRERGVDRIEAETIIGLKYGELSGDNDILFLQPLTEEERRTLGLGRSIHEVVADERSSEQR